MIEAWWVRETRHGHRASTANAYRFLRAVLRKAVRDSQHDGPNPCQILGAGSAKSGRQLAAISSSELASIVSYASPQFAFYLTLSFVAAMRFEEATALRVSDVMRTQIDGAPSYSLSITKSVVRVGGEFVIGPTKTKAGTRITHLPSSIYGMLENYLSSLDGGSESLLFPSEQQGTYIHNSVLNKQLKRVCEAAGLGSKRFTLHSLRRGGATALSENGATHAEVQQLLGDQSLAAAMLYVRPTTRLAALIEKFDLSGVS
jgi:integrase